MTTKKSNPPKGGAASSKTPRPRAAKASSASQPDTVDAAWIADASESGAPSAGEAARDAQEDPAAKPAEQEAVSASEQAPAGGPVSGALPATEPSKDAGKAADAGGSAWTMSFREGNIAVLTLDVPGQPVNTLQARFAEDFQKTLATLEQGIDAGRVRAAVIVSGKRDSFLAGADIDMLKQVHSAAEATKLSQTGQAGMQRVEDLGQRIPVVAAIHGACLGGGLELALACSSRVASDDPKTVLGLPEVQLGLIPGAGGTQRLPRLVGLQTALDLILTGKQLKAQKAQRIGLVDEVVPAAILLDVAVARAQRLAEAASPEPRRGPAPLSAAGFKKLALEDNPLGRKVMFDQAKKMLMRKTRGNYPAPERALEVIRAGYRGGVAAGYAAEARAFGGLVVSPQAAQLIEIFKAVTALKKDSGTDDASAKARPVRKVGMLGAGLMGAGIAYVTASLAKTPVRLKDKDEKGLSHGLKYARELLEERVKKKRLLPRERDAQMMLISPTTDYRGFADCDVVVEAVFEDLGIKHKVLREVEQAGRPDVIFASNTSSLPITRIADASAHPETVIGMHYFSPVHKMPLLEVIVTDKTAPWVTATCVELGKKQGKTVIVVRDGVGFYTSRILGPYMNEAAHLLAQGVPIDKLDEALVDFGFPVGPITLLDEVGIDVAEKVGHIVHAAFGERLSPPPGIDTLVKNGRHGRKNGKGFYLYSDSAKKKSGRKQVDTSIYGELGLKTPAAGEQGPVSKEEIQYRCTLQMVNEAALCLGEGILRSARDGDIGAIFGLGFPPFLGGPFRFVDSLGAKEVVRRLTEFEAKYGERFKPAPLLVELAATGSKFHAG